MKFKLTTTIPTSPERVYQAWLSSKQHTSMKGGEAKCTKRSGGTFSAEDAEILRLVAAPTSLAINNARNDRIGLPKMSFERGHDRNRADDQYHGWE